MKISEIKQCFPESEPTKTKRADGPPGEFTRLLEEESEKMGEDIRGVGSGMEPVALPSLMGFQPAAVQGGRSEEYGKAELAVEGAIDRLEKLQLALQDLKGDLKTVGSAIGELSASAGELQEKVSSLPENDLLRRMADELSVVAHVESIKYRRGDYL